MTKDKEYRDVTIIDLPPEQVVSAYGYGEGPEDISGRVLRGFIRQMGWDDAELRRHRIYGFNNPDPAEGSTQYGYEQWITVDDGFVLPDQPGEDISLKTLLGGLYAALRSEGIPNPVKWGKVVQWINGSEYQYDASRQWLEELIVDSTSLNSLLEPDDAGSAAEGDPAGHHSPENWTFNLLSPVIPAAMKIR